MRTLHPRARLARAGQRGVALLLALLLLVVLIAITIQISVTTGTDARIARNDMTMSSMDLAIESALLQVDEALKADGESASQESEGAGAAAAPGATGAQAPGAAAAPGAPGAGQSEASDSQRDEWHQPQRTEINDIRLRIFVQDEDSKYNVLNIVNPDEGEAKLAEERVVRILDWCREGSREYDIDTRLAESMVKTMKEHLMRRGDSKIPRPKLLTDVEGQDGGLPLTLEEFAPLQPFEEHHFRDLRDRDGEVVHSIASFLTVWTSLGVAGDLPQTGKAGSTSAAGAAGAGAKASSGATGSKGAQSTGKDGSTAQAGETTGGTTQGGTSGAGTDGQGGAAGTAGTPGSSGPTTSGGYAVNVNTAPAAVLKGLFDDRDIHPRLFDRILEYRNLEEEEKESDTSSEEAKKDEEEIQLDEYGREKIERRIFESLAELSEVDGFKDLPTEQQNKMNQILTTKSNVFSIYVVARRSTSVQGDMDGGLDPVEMRKREETEGDALVRVVRSVVWRRTIDEDVVLIPIVRWEVVDYLPFEVLDFPPDDR